MKIKEYMITLGQQARLAATEMSRADSGKKNQALLNIAEVIENNQAMLVDENRKDLDAGKQNDLKPALLDRLDLTPLRIRSMVEGLRQIVALADPVGAISGLKFMPSGIQVGQMRVPLGVSASYMNPVLT